MTDIPPKPPSDELPSQDARYKPPTRFSQPKPPALPKRFMLLLVEPEKWAQAAMYPASATFWPLVWALIIATLCMGYSMCAGSIKPLQAFAASYDQRFLPMQINKGQLSIISPKGKTKLIPMKVQTPVETVLADPALAGAAKLKTDPLIVLFDRDSVVLTGSTWGGSWIIMPMAQLQREVLAVNGQIKPSLAKSLPTDKLPAIILDSKTLPALMPLTSVILGLGSLPAFLLGFCLWTVLMVFMTGFLIMSINRNIGMPLKVAWRISMAVMIPLLVLRGLLAVFGVVPAMNQSPMIDQIIYMTPIALALWAAVLANRKFSKPSGGKPRNL